jgi:hypothetical protein
VEAKAVAVGRKDGADGKDGAETDGHRGEGRAGCSIRRDGSESRQHQSGRDFQGSQATNSPAKPRELSKFPMVTGIQHWSSADSSTVVVNLEDQVQYKAHRLPNPDRIYFDLRDTQLASNLAWKSIEVGDALLNRIRVAQPVSGITRIVLETKAKVDFSVSLEPNPYRLMVEVRKVGASS